MRKIRIKYVDFWRGFDEVNNFFTGSLGETHDLVRVENNPDILIYSCFGEQHYTYTDYDCVKIFFTGENLIPDFNECDYGMGFHFLDFGDRYLRCPLYARHPDFMNVIAREQFTQENLAKKTAFCNFVFSNGRADPKRDSFFHALSKYKKVQSAGNHLRNTESFDIPGKPSENGRRRIEFLAGHKFTIAFENSECPGYTTEKIVDAFSARTIPIYWGNPRIVEDFNPDSFINTYDFEDQRSLVEEVARIDKDDARYLQIINQPVLADANHQNKFFQDRLNNFLHNIVDQPVTSARRRTKYGRARIVETRQKRHHSGIRLALKKLGLR